MESVFLQQGIVGAMLLISLYANWHQYNKGQEKQEKHEKQYLSLLDRYNDSQAKTNLFMQSLNDRDDIKQYVDEKWKAAEDATNQR